MKCKIVHESRGRLRISLFQKNMTLKQADILEAYLLTIKEVDQAAVHERTCCIVIQYIGDRDKVLKALSRFDYNAPGMEDLLPMHSSREMNRYYQEKLVGTVTGKVLRTVFLPVPVQIAITVCKSIPYIFKGIKCLVNRKMKVEVLDAVSIGVSIIRGDFATAGSVMFLLRIGEILEEWTRKKSMDDLARCMSLNIDKVWMKKDDEEILIPINQIKAGDEVVVRMGNIIPLDGVIVDGDVTVNQSSLTGESIPVAKHPGTNVYAGTVVEEGECTIKVIHQSGEGRYDKIVSMIEDSERFKSSAESKAYALADKLVPYTLLGSGLTFLLSRNVTRALSVLMVDFSCALKLSMPITVLSAMREAGTYHMSVKGGKYLEAIADADTIVFDKTGTLTYACPRVADIVTFGDYKENDMLRVAACLEEHFPHSMANAVVKEAKNRDLQHEEMHTKVEYIVAHGISSTVQDKQVVIGSAHFVFEDEKCIIPEAEKDKFDALPPQWSQLYLAIGGVLAAVICISDPLRTEAKEVVSQLKKAGFKKVVMLTGDSERTAAAIAKEVGVDEYRSEVLPDDKASYVDEQRKAGHIVVMLGDGINDSPALSAANVGIAVSGGAAIAREIADITITADSLRELVTLRMLSEALMKRINANHRFVIGFNGSLILLGVLGILAPATSAMLHNVSTIALSLNSMTNLLEEDKIKKIEDEELILQEA